MLGPVARRMTSAQVQAEIRRLQRQQKQAVDKWNSHVRQYNAAVKQAVNDYNREVRAYNANARTHNSKIENQRRRLNQEIHAMPLTMITPAAISRD